MDSNINKKFNRLTIIEYVGVVKRRKTYLCLCECGEKTKVALTYLKNGTIKSCGCLAKETSRETCIKRNLRHGGAKDRLYNIWKNLRQRCYNPKASGYKSYGLRGIKVCKEWESFENFKEWSLKNGYKENLTIDRIDNDKDYCPSNCQWLTRSENTIKRNKLYRKKN